MKKSILLFWLMAAQLGAQATSSPKSFVLSDELNRQLPSWLRFSGEYRARFEGPDGIGFRPDNEDAYVLDRIRINMVVQPASWFKVVAQGQDARAFWKTNPGPAPPYQNKVDLRLAFVELGDSEKKAAGVRVGRQELNFGDQRLVGSSNWTNTARSFDAVRATVRHNGYRLDVFAASVVVAQDGRFDHHQQGNNLHGIYGGIEKLVPNAVIEPYVFWRLAPRQRTEPGKLASLDSKTTGIRWVGKIPASFDYGLEMAIQRGSLGPESIRAWAGHWVGGYTVSTLRYQPRFLVEYNYATGDKAPNDGQRNTFDQLYPTSHDKYGLADQIGWRNIRDIRTGVETHPHAKWLVSGIYHDWYLASARDGLYNSAGTLLLRKADGSAGTHVGQEIDAQAAYNWNKQTLIGFGFGHIFPGEFIRKTSPGKAYNFPYVSFGYLF